MLKWMKLEREKGRERKREREGDREGMGSRVIVEGRSYFVRT